MNRVLGVKLISVLAIVMASLYEYKYMPLNQNHLSAGYFIGFTLLTIVIHVLLIHKNISPHGYFIISYLFFGVIFLISMPVGSVPDENGHFSRAYTVSNGVLINPVGSHQANAGTIPTIMESGGAIKFWSDVPKNLVNKTMQKSDMVGSGTSYGSAMYSPINYIPQAAGIYIMRILDNTILNTFYFARFFNFLFFMVLVYFAIKILPCNKMFIIVCGLLPMTVHQAVSLSADSINIGFSFLFIALMGSLFFRQNKLNISEYIALSACSIALGFMKQSMLPFLMLTFMVKLPFKSQNSRLRFVVLMCALGLIAYLFWLYQLNKYGVSYAYMQYVHGMLNTFSSIHEAIVFIVMNPLKYMHIIMNTFKSQYIELFKGSIGILGCLKIKLNWWNYWLGLIVIMISLMINDKEYKISSIARIVPACTIMIFILLTLFALFVGWTPRGFGYVAGLQGRYFIPMLAVLPLVLGNSWLSSYQNIVEIMIKTILFINLYCAVVAIFYFYY